MKAIKLLPKYIYKHLAIVIFFIICVGIFAGISTLYHAQTEAVLYAFLLCAFVGLIFFVINFIPWYKKYNEYEILKNNILAMPLPVPSSLMEAELLNVIKKLRDKNIEDIQRGQIEKSEMFDYFSSWVHQIKTPIAVMQLRLQNEDTEENRALLSELFKTEQYVEMALNYFRLDGTDDFVFKEFDLDTIIKEAVRKYAPLMIQKKLTFEYTPTTVKVITDKKWLLFIIEQLLSNAVKYTESGTIKIEVCDKKLKISDTGIGIAEEDIPCIFDKGYTGFNGRVQRKSTGLGLYLCKKAADKLSHKISVESEVGEGTTFTVDMQTYNLLAE